MLIAITCINCGLYTFAKVYYTLRSKYRRQAWEAMALDVSFGPTAAALTGLRNSSTTSPRPRTRGTSAKTLWTLYTEDTLPHLLFCHGAARIRCIAVALLAAVVRVRPRNLRPDFLPAHN